MMKIYRKGTWKPCKSCGGTNVERSIGLSFKEGMEWVIVNCASCGNRRSSYERKKGVR